MDEIGMDLARDRSVVIRSLDQEPGRVLAGILPISQGAGSRGIKAVFSPQPGWSWKMLELDFSIDRFEATIAGRRFEGRCSQQGVRTMHNGQFADFTKLLVSLARKDRLGQRREVPAQRKRISRFRETLRALFPLEGEPVRRGLGQFRIWNKLAEQPGSR